MSFKCIILSLFVISVCFSSPVSIIGKTNENINDHTVSQNILSNLYPKSAISFILLPLKSSNNKHSKNNNASYPDKIKNNGKKSLESLITQNIIFHRNKKIETSKLDLPEISDQEIDLYSATTQKLPHKDCNRNIVSTLLAKTLLLTCLLLILWTIGYNLKVSNSFEPHVRSKYSRRNRI